VSERHHCHALGSTGSPFIRYREIENGEQEISLPDRKGGNPEEWAFDLRVRQWPEAAA